MAYTQDDLDALQAAIAKGASRVRIGSEEVQFRSLNEMLRTEERIKRALAQPTKTRMAYPPTKTGWR